MLKRKMASLLFMLLLSPTVLIQYFGLTLGAWILTVSRHSWPHCRFMLLFWNLTLPNFEVKHLTHVIDICNDNVLISAKYILTLQNIITFPICCNFWWAYSHNWAKKLLADMLIADNYACSELVPLKWLLPFHPKSVLPPCGRIVEIQQPQNHSNSSSWMYTLDTLWH